MYKVNNKLFRKTLDKIFIFIILISILVSCQKDDPALVNHYLKSSSLIATITKENVLFLTGMIPEVNAAVSEKVQFGAKVYKLSYKTTDVSGAEIIASGALLVPDGLLQYPLLSYQHGTLFSEEEAPSNFATGSEIRILAPILASTGYIVSVPDYLGYGVSKNYPHPYEHAKTLGSASFDMLMASKEFLANNSIIASDKLFLAGYSEGGGATMALHKHIEENSDLVVTMSAPASGAYNKTAFAKAILQKDEELNFLPNFMWVIDAYNWIYDINRSWDQYVNPPWAGTLENVVHPFDYASADIEKNPQLLFTTATREGILNGTDLVFTAALADNDLIDWEPKYPITLYFGTADDYVFPINSETAYAQLLENGATITKVAYPDADHDGALIPYVLDMFELFELLK
jgi:dienelactone hydrolase